SQHPQVVRQHTPADSQLAMLDSLAADRPAQEVVNDNANASFGLRATALELDEFPGAHALLSLVGSTRLNPSVGFLLVQSVLIVVSIESTLVPELFDLDWQ